MPNPTHKLITSYTVTSGGTSSVTLSSIPGTYTDLKLITSTKAGTSGGSYWNDTFFNFNNDTGYNYAEMTLFAYDANTPSSTTSYTDRINLIYGAGANSGTNVFGNSEIYIAGYASSNAKPVAANFTPEDTAAPSSYWILGMTSGVWTGSAAITSITITPSSGTFAQYSTFYLYGITNA